MRKGPILSSQGSYCPFKSLRSPGHSSYSNSRTQHRAEYAKCWPEWDWGYGVGLGDRRHGLHNILCSASLLFHQTSLSTPLWGSRCFFGGLELLEVSSLYCAEINRETPTYSLRHTGDLLLLFYGSLPKLRNWKRGPSVASLLYLACHSLFLCPCPPCLSFLNT